MAAYDLGHHLFFCFWIDLVMGFVHVFLEDTRRVTSK